MSELIYMLDSEGLSKAVLGDRRMGSILKDADRSGIRVVTTSMTLVEAYHKRVKRDAWRWTLSKIAVESVTGEIADHAISLLEGAGLHGHKYAIDAALAAVALRERGDVTIFTSDVEDMTTLCGDRVVVLGI
jgi:predicted nucleic acid-binding protein